MKLRDWIVIGLWFVLAGLTWVVMLPVKAWKKLTGMAP